jgi:hypothetical protein
MTSIPSNNFPIPKRPYAVFISNKDSRYNADEKTNNIPSCRACGNRRMEPLEGEGVYICCGCGTRVPISTPMPMLQSQVNQQGQGQQTTQQQQQSSTKGGIKVVSGVPTTQSGREKIAFAQPKHQSVKDWFKRKHDPKNNGKYDADDIALMNRSGVTITHTFEIKRRPDTDTLQNPTDYENENRNRKRT